MAKAALVQETGRLTAAVVLRTSGAAEPRTKAAARSRRDSSEPRAAAHRRMRVESREGGSASSPYREAVAHGPQQVAEPERFGQPAAAALLEKCFGLGPATSPVTKMTRLASAGAAAAIAR